MYSVTIQLEDEIALSTLLERIMHQAGVPIPSMVRFSSLSVNRIEDKETTMLYAEGMPVAEVAEEITKNQTAFTACSSAKDAANDKQWG